MQTITKQKPDTTQLAIRRQELLNDILALNNYLDAVKPAWQARKALRKLETVLIYALDEVEAQL